MEVLWGTLLDLSGVVLVASVQLLLSLLGRYITRERGLVFDTLIGGCCGGLFAMFFTSEAEGWRLRLDKALDAWCLERPLICWPMPVLYVLFWIVYWTLFPALLAAGLLRAGRGVGRCFTRRGTLPGAS